MANILRSAYDAIGRRMGYQATPSPHEDMEATRDGQGTIVKEATMFRPIEPKQTPIITDVSKGFTSIVQIAMDVLINPDVAYRADQRQQEQMLHDPMIMGPLQKRMLATALLDFEIVPENAKDLRQAETAKNIERIVRNIPRWSEFIRTLGMATFRGTSASEAGWYYNPLTKNYEINNHRPWHGDKITFDIWGNPRILTRDFQTGGRELDKREKDRLIIHTFDREDGDFYDGAQAGYVFKGRGLRDMIWPYWFLKQNALKFWVTLLERQGTGFIEGRYPMGNAQAKTAIESVLQNLINDSKFSNPVPQGADKETYGIVVHENKNVSTGSDAFVRFVEEFAGKHIRIAIEGQEQAQQESGDGLGSGRSDALQDIFRMYRDYDASLIQDTITEQLVGRIQWFNYGYLPFKCKFQFILEKTKYEEQEKRVAAAKNAGMKVKKDWLYETLDIPELDGTETEGDVVDFGAQALSSGGALFTPHPVHGNDTEDNNTFFSGHESAKYAAMFREALKPQTGDTQ